MAEIKDGGAAFPVADQGIHGTFGMTLRDWFAGQALAGLLAGVEERHFNPATDGDLDGWRDRISNEWARFCYRQADAMLAVREG